MLEYDIPKRILLYSNYSNYCIPFAEVVQTKMSHQQSFQKATTKTLPCPFIPSPTPTKKG